MAIKWLHLWSDSVMRVRTDCYIWLGPPFCNWHKADITQHFLMSALGGKADIGSSRFNVR